ncbi:MULTISPECIES: multidrug efflux RND transporter permease subunit [unclassified Variovorax]|uniref:efflux RND transporter permease subunit n=1 Tax=unclassified Variovorax TaxID=663243 RepID=UPI00076D2F1B|nr:MULTISPECIES: multidrug efflux RND transporter permease subunit [unclassified Variovorax]KWT64509.1 RND efflux system, inner membrane transporter CmeB [Variovorax sp. WDL1]PNG56382.1 Efflux pump membrane transporter BepE [Variovorax sp. B4]PNG57806.1 Efflux pump membrane transporter BepE [Variovorax sp. B2]VTV09754.1 Efflux pump membrane transporter BepE [Variovorax sp. WDL1]
MDISRFFIERPRFAAVLSIFIFLVGLLSIFQLPVSEYPDVTPPQIVVRAQFPGANPRVVSETVATPLEEQINGVENMLYYESQATANGSLNLTVTFRIGTSPEQAETAVQNRVNRALPRLPEIVRQIGVITEKQSPNLTMVVHMVSPDQSRDTLYLRNYAHQQVRDELLRIPGMGSVMFFGGGDYAMRIWLDPQKLAGSNMTAGDVVAAVREQNVQVAAGVVGAPPSPRGTEFQLAVNTRGRLVREEEFADIIVRTDPATGALIRIRDVGRVEISSNSYAVGSLINNKEAAAIGIFQAPGSNALEVSERVRATMARLKADFPQGVDYAIVYDPTRFVQISIDKVVHTLVEAVLLVVLVVILFLQTWRASIIPLLAVPVSIVGTFAVLLALGYSINTLTLFGLVLAIGIVVDDAIVVVENVERNLEDGLTPHDASVKAMREVSGPIVAIALVLCAVFVPLTFVPGLSGQFYKQFAATIAISTVISAINSLTLSPALAAILLRPHDAPKDAVMRVMDRLFGRFFRWFNHAFHLGSENYSRGVSGLLKRKSIALAVYAGLLLATVVLISRIPSGFVPAPDKQYLIGIAQLPAGATLERTERVLREMTEIALKVPGIVDVTSYPGLSIAGFSSAPNEGVLFFLLAPFEERRSRELSKEAVLARVNGAIQAIQGARMFVVPPPAVDGLGNAGGFKLQVQDRGGQGEQALFAAVRDTLRPIYADPASSIGTPYSNYDINVPQLFANVDRTKAKQMGVALQDIYDTLQINLGSLYVNDFNRFGKTYQVIVQADTGYRTQARSIIDLKTRNGRGEMVSLGALMQVEPTFGPTRVTRYNGFPSADINGAAKPGVSSSQAEGEIERLLKNIPRGMSYEWTELSYQDRLTRDVAVPGLGVKIPTLTVVLLLSVILVVLVLAAQYESWSLPLSIVLIVPMCILSALFGVWLSHLPPFGQVGDLNLFTQVALVVLVGLACKNAILIVEFAKELEERGKPIVEAVIEACRLRLRPILMTSIAFCAGVIPLILGSGAGSEMRRAMGVAVFSGMVGVTLFGIFLTPLFYVLLRKSTEKQRADAAELRHQIDAAAHPFHPGVDDALPPQTHGAK